MKYCPTCETRYDEEVLRFCMKDGTPLLDEDEPNFIAMPSENLDEADEDSPDDVTVIRRNISVPPPLPDDFEEESFAPEQPPPPRIVVPTSPEPFADQQRVRAMPPYQPPPSNTAKVVFLTMIGTLAVLAVGAAGFWLMQRDSNANNSNINTNANFLNVNTNLNTNLGIDGNFNFNTNSDLNTSTNLNTNLNVKTPTPTPRPSPSITPTPTPDDDDDDPTPTPTRTPFPTQTPIIIRPGVTPPPRSTPTPPTRDSNSGVLNGRAVRLPTPAYPAAAKQMRASGEVRVQVAVDERGNVVSARAVSGHPLLRASAESAARQSKIRPNGQNTSGELVYNFRSN
ncbi:MAG: TonB family protein [Saprospiraceae bacterium]|nr:TonB family protein [Pyrinomonadaceae bacterium]